MIIFIKEILKKSEFFKKMTNKMKRIILILILYSICFQRRMVDHNPNQFFPEIIFFSVACPAYDYRVTHEC